MLVGQTFVLAILMCARAHQYHSYMFTIHIFFKKLNQNIPNKLDPATVNSIKKRK